MRPQDIKFNSQIAKEIKSDLIDALLEIYPEEIDGEVGVGKFRTEFHRIYQAGDGWLTGGKSTYVIVDVMGKLCKFSKSERKGSGWAYHSESGGSFGLGNLAKKKIFGHKIENYKISQARRENGTLYQSMR